MRTLVVMLVGVGCAAGANAEVLWDQSSLDLSVNALVDQEFGDFPEFSSYMATDVVTDPGGWLVDAVTTYFTVGHGDWSAVTQARLNVFEKTGALPVGADDPGSGAVVSVAKTYAGDHWEITAAGLGLYLDGGEYWIGLTPIGDFTTVGQEFRTAAAPLVGAPTAWRNPGGAFGYGSDWLDASVIDWSGTWSGSYDAAFKIEGVIVPEPSGLALLGLGAVLLRRSR